MGVTGTEVTTDIVASEIRKAALSRLTPGRVTTIPGGPDEGQEAAVPVAADVTRRGG